MNRRHALARRKHLTCECGYVAENIRDIDDHVVALARCE